MNTRSMHEHAKGSIVEYRDGDFNKRLNLYLQFPRIGLAFGLIDRQDLTSDGSTGIKMNRYTLLTQCRDVYDSITLKAVMILGNVSG